MASTLQSMMSPRRAKSHKEWPGFIDALRTKNYAALRKMGSEEVVKASNMGEASGILGGYAVPPDFNMSIATSYEENCFFYPRATVVPMFSRTTSLPRPNVETAQSTGVPPWCGGMTFSWGLEAGSITQTNPTLAQNQLVARNLIGTIILSMDLMQDLGAAGDEFLFNMFARGSAWNEEYAFFNGNGITQPQGIIGSSGRALVTRASGNTIGAADIQGMAAKMTPLGWTKAIWACSPGAMAKITAITGFIPNQSGMDTIGISAAGSLLGRPLFVSDKLAALGTIGDLVFFDPSQYLIGERAELIVQVAMEEPSVFTSFQAMYRIWRRLDGQPLFSSVITLPNGSTVSPNVILNT